MPKLGEGGPIPDFVDRAELAASVAKQEAKDAATIAELTAPPAEPGAYKMPSPPPGVDAIPLERVPAIQAAALDVGLTLNEFQTIAHVVYLFAASPQALQTDPKLYRLHSDAMGSELDRRHSPERAIEIAQAAVDAIAAARAKAPEMATALRRMILLNRPLLELLARVGQSARSVKDSIDGICGSAVAFRRRALN